jgi:hypothetical protein
MFNRQQYIEVLRMHDEYRKPKAPPAIGHAALAMKEGFYLEAITLYEGVIEYLLLNYFNSIRDSQVRFASLSALVGKLRASLNEHTLSDSEQRLMDLLYDLELWSKSLMAMRYEVAEVQEEQHWKKAIKLQKKKAKQARKFHKKITSVLLKIERDEMATDKPATQRKISATDN